jgi:hypothetical protein
MRSDLLAGTVPGWFLPEMEPLDGPQDPIPHALRMAKSLVVAG